MSNEARLLALVEHSSDLLAILDGDGRVDLVNPAVETLLGHRPDAFQGTLFVDYAHEDDRPALGAVLGEPGGDSVEVRFRTATSEDDASEQDAAFVVLEVATRRPREGSGVDGVVVDARDVTERRQVREAIRESEARYRRLFEESREAILIGTIEGRILDINPAAIRLFGYRSKEEMLRLDIGRDLYWAPDDRERASAKFAAQGFLEDEELDLRSSDGRRLRVQESASPLHDADGALTGFHAVLRDITDQRRLEEQLRQSQKMEAVGRLAGGVAHDFNNLLTAINGYAELMLARMDDDDPQVGAAEEIRKAGRRATDLTRRLLTLSRHQVVSPRQISLNRCVLDMEKLLQRVIGEDIHLRTQLDQDLPQIYADQGQVEQIILNLAVNARDAMPEGGAFELGTQQIRVPSETVPFKIPVPGDYVMLEVRDTGIGMERKVREHAFEPFFTTKGQGHNTGLGLAIVYGIVKQSGGYIDIESREGEGAKISIVFPLQTPKKVDRPESTVSPRHGLPRGSETVLLVEDETSVRTLVRQILELQGYRVLAARNAKAATALCEEHDASPDLLLTDVVMPGRSGLALAEDLQQRYSDLKILFMSGYTDSHSGVKLLTQQKAAFLPKPFSPDVLAR
ncbi:MAG: PAS domain S-box protein, partial [Acidobacteriota bacterium]